MLRSAKNINHRFGEDADDSLCPVGSLHSPPRALPTETKVESGTSQSKSGTSVNLSNSGEPASPLAAAACRWPSVHASNVEWFT